MRYVALLRGINVGGKHSLPMKELTAVVQKLGGQDVRTYIQSGNVGYGLSAAEAAKFPERLEKALKAKFGFEVPVIQRSAKELAKVAKAHPFERRELVAKFLHVVFLKGKADAEGRKLMEAMPLPNGERLQFAGQELYLFYPLGIASTKLVNSLFDSKLKTICTVRNWNSVKALLELAAEGKP